MNASIESAKSWVDSAFFVAVTTTSSTSWEVTANDKKTIGNRNKFFFLGPKNDWRKILDKSISDEIEKKFEKEMKELNYIWFINL